MRNVRDTFLHFLADNLDPSITVHPVRRQPNDPALSRFKLSAVNVEFVDLTPALHFHKQSVAIDLIHEDELTCVDWLNEIWKLLSAAYYTPCLSYADPDNPVAVGGHISWDAATIRFRKVSSESYCHYSAVFPLLFKF